MRFRIVYQLFLFFLCPMLLSAQTYSDYHPIIQNGGIVKKAADEDFYVPVGTSVNITSGKIL